MEIIDVREHKDIYGGIQWLLTLKDGRGVHVVWPEAHLIAKLSVTPFTELWSAEFSKSDNQVLAVYLPDEQEKTWAVARKHLERKFTFAPYLDPTMRYDD